MDNKTKALLFIIGCIVVAGISYQSFSKASLPVYDATPQDEYVYDYQADNQEVETAQGSVTDVEEDVTRFDYLFESATTSGQYSNIVGTLAYESFAWYVPDWLIENWDMKEYEGRGEGMAFTPKGNVDLKMISGISFYYEPSSESFNAATMYENENNGKILIKEILLSQHKEGELQITMEPETRIYHVQSESINMISDAYMMDGNGYTLRIHFMADKAIFQRYANKIRNMVDGIGEVRGPRG